MLNHFTIPSNAFTGPVLITGAGGCIGAWTIAMLLKNNIDASIKKFREMLPEYQINEEN